MNERIAKLMDQAGELAYEEHKAKCLKNGLNPMMPFGNNLAATFEKFAELIVRECAEVIAPMGDWCGGHGEPSMPSTMECAKKLKEHFGVE